MNILPGNLRFGAGQPIKRLEDQRLLTGKGQFIDDRPEEGALWLHVLRSPHAHAGIVSIDTGAASEMPGVEAVYTGADLVADDIGTIPTLAIFKRQDGKPMTVPPRRLLAHEVVRFAGEPVAAVVASSRVLAQNAAEAIVVEYGVLPSVVDPVEATKPGAPVVWEEAPDNIVAAMSYGDAARVEDAFAVAAHRVSLDLVSQRLVPSVMEPRSTIAEVENTTGRLILHVQSEHFCFSKLDFPTAEEEAAGCKALEETVETLAGRYGVVVIDTPGHDDYLSRVAHSLADTLITPLNDSFVDLDVLGTVDPETFRVTGTSHYAQMVEEARGRRRLQYQGVTDWIVLRNRLSVLGSRNKRLVGEGLGELSHRLNFRCVDGLAERVIFREFYPRGLTAVDDIDEITLGTRPTMSHVSARNLLTTIGLGNAMTAGEIAERRQAVA